MERQKDRKIERQKDRQKDRKIERQKEKRKKGINERKKVRKEPTTPTEEDKNKINNTTYRGE